MQFNENVEIVLPLRQGELENCMLWLLSIQQTCKLNDIYVTIVDVDGVTNSVDAAFIKSSLRTSVVSCTEGVDNLSVAFNAGIRHVKSLRPDSYFYMFCHADVIGIIDGWLDQALEVLLNDEVGCVGFPPGGKLVTAIGELNDYVDDWLFLTKRDILDRIGEFPETLKSFGVVVWFYAALSLQGLQERLLVGGGGLPLVGHSRKSGQKGIGRKQKKEIFDPEMKELARLLRELWGIKE